MTAYDWEAAVIVVLIIAAVALGYGVGHLLTP